MSILDSIIENQTAVKGEVKGDATATIANTSPIFPVHPLDSYRGFAKPVNEVTSLNSLLNQTGLNWKVCERPVLVQGKNENLTFEGKKALIRCDNGDMIEITSDTFKVHQNEEIVGAMAETLGKMNAVVTKGGYFPESGKVFLEARLDTKFNAPKVAQGHNFGHSFEKGAISRTGAKVGDMIALDLFVSGGHKPGTPFKMKGVAKRLACSNGATVSELFNMIRLTHRQSMAAIDGEKIKRFQEDVLEAFAAYESQYGKLNTVAASKGIQDAYILNVVQGEDILNAIVKRQGLTGADLISEIIERDEKLRTHNADWLLDTIAELKRKEVPVAQDVPRIFSRIDEVLDSQPGGDFTRGTLANAYNATTYYVDHLRGRGGEAAVEDALDGSGDRLKRSAMSVATVWANAMVGRA